MKIKIIMTIFVEMLALSLSFANVEIANSADATGNVRITATSTPSGEGGSNLIEDPGFEGIGQGHWITDNWAGPWDNNYDAIDYNHSGSQSLKQVPNGTNVSSKWEKAEAKQIFQIQPGKVINGGAWLKWENLSKVEAFVECKWLDTNKRELGGGISTEHKISGSGKWEYQDLSMWTIQERTAPPNAAYVDFRLVFLSAGYADTATGTVWWDDAQFEIASR